MRKASSEPAATLPPGALAEAIRRIVDAVAPEKIILFGSAARQEAGPHSDFDLLVVKAGTYSKSALMSELYMRLQGVGAPIDIVVATPEELEKYGNCAALVYYAALREGKLMYAA
ncbi:MAG: nucleotidyltransferase domain-containing protein [Gemmatimonadota bacterium]